MSKFSLIKSENVQNDKKITIWELCKNDESLFQSFLNDIKENGNLFDNTAGAIRIIEDTADLSRRPKNQFRELKGQGLDCKLYEAKSGIIRVYLFHEEKTGRIIITGGLKDNQEKDIKKVVTTIKQYYNEK